MIEGRISTMGVAGRVRRSARLSCCLCRPGEHTALHGKPCVNSLPGCPSLGMGLWLASSCIR